MGRDLTMHAHDAVPRQHEPVGHGEQQGFCKMQFAAVAELGIFANIACRFG